MGADAGPVNFFFSSCGGQWTDASSPSVIGRAMMGPLIFKRKPGDVQKRPTHVATENAILRSPTSYHTISNPMEATDDQDETAILGITSSDSLQQSDKEDVVLAHRYRLSLPSKPRQSSFRVLSLIFYEIPPSDEITTIADGLCPGLPTLAPWIAHTTNDGRSFVFGTNDEAGYMGGAICAERAAFVQFRFLPTFRVTKVVITTDSIDPITPGLLCREFLAGHPTVPWNVPVITTGCICTVCGKKNESLFSNVSKSDKDFMTVCCDDSVEHSLPTVQTTIRDLYPYPSPYTRLTASQSITLGEAYSARASQDFESLEEPDSKRLLELAIMEARTNVSDLHPIQFGAAAIFDDGVIVTSHQICALEYGCTLDAVSQLALHFQEGATPLLLVQADQYGIAHAPFAPARAFLSEHGFENCQVVVHDAPSYNNDEDIFDFDNWTLKEVFVSELAPNAPTWTQGTDRAAYSDFLVEPLTLV